MNNNKNIYDNNNNNQKNIRKVHFIPKSKTRSYDVNKNDENNNKQNNNNPLVLNVYRYDNVDCLKWESTKNRDGMDLNVPSTLNHFPHPRDNSNNFEHQLNDKKNSYENNDGNKNVYAGEDSYKNHGDDAVKSDEESDELTEVSSYTYQNFNKNNNNKNNNKNKNKHYSLKITRLLSYPEPRSTVQPFNNYYHSNDNNKNNNINNNYNNMMNINNYKINNENKNMGGNKFLSLPTMTRKDDNWFFGAELRLDSNNKNNGKT